MSLVTWDIEGKADAYHQNNRAPLYKIALKALVDNPARSVNVKSSEYVVKKKNLSRGIEGSGQSEASLEKGQQLKSQVRKEALYLLSTTRN